MEILDVITGALIGGGSFLIAAMALIQKAGPGLLAAIETIEKNTEEGTKIDDALDKAILVIARLLKYSTTQNSAYVQSVVDRLKAKKAQ